MAKSPPSPAARWNARRLGRPSIRSRAPTAATRRCFKTAKSTPSTIRCRTACTPSGASKCAEAGIPTLSEKPFASDAPEAQSIVDAFEEREPAAGGSLHVPLSSAARQSQEILAAGGIGELQIINSSFTFPVSDGANIRLSKIGWRRADGCRLLLRQSDALHDRRRTGARRRRQPESASAPALTRRWLARLSFPPAYSGTSIAACAPSASTPTR